MVNIDTLIQHQGHLFEKKKSLDSLHQEIADNFYPERADFTVNRYLGEEFAEHLMSSYPVVARRDLGDSFSAMLRRDNWFEIRLAREERETYEVKRWLESATGIMRRAMYDRPARFVRATKEGDHDFAAFGQAVLSVEVNRGEQRLLYRNWHLRDCAWCENESGEIDTVYRKWKPTVRELAAKFKTISPQLEAIKTKEPYREVECGHCVMPGDKRKYKSIYYDCENKFIFEEVDTDHFMYVIPRWSTVSGSQYAYSPAVIASLPDARLIQAITLTLLEAGEKYTSPPLLATQEAIRSDVNLMPGGITWVDASYDERLGEVLRPISQDKSGFPAGFNIRDDVKEAIAQAFYLNKLNLPPQGDMTAYEVSQRIQEYIRQALPLFAPMESEYNGGLCDATFELMMSHGAFGSDIPEDLLGQEVKFEFDSPLRASEGRAKSAAFQEMLELMGLGAQVDPNISANIDIHEAFREASDGVGVPADWVVDEDAAAEIVQERQAMAQIQKLADVG